MTSNLTGDNVQYMSPTRIRWCVSLSFTQRKRFQKKKKKNIHIHIHEVNWCVVQPPHYNYVVAWRVSFYFRHNKLNILNENSHTSRFRIEVTIKCCSIHPPLSRNWSAVFPEGRQFTLLIYSNWSRLFLRLMRWFKDLTFQLRKDNWMTSENIFCSS